MQPHKPNYSTGKRIAIIGSGPAGKHSENIQLVSFSYNFNYLDEGSQVTVNLIARWIRN